MDAYPIMPDDVEAHNPKSSVFAVNGIVDRTMAIGSSGVKDLVRSVRNEPKRGVSVSTIVGGSGADYAPASVPKCYRMRLAVENNVGHNNCFKYYRRGVPAQLRDCFSGVKNMSHIPTLRARLPEWNTVLDAMRFYSRHLEERRAMLDSDSDEYLVVGDDLIRLDALIPDLERQVKELTDRAITDALVHQ